MLKEYKDIYVASASTIPNYKKISQIDLANKYIEGGPDSEAYLSALIVRYWNIIDKMIYKDRGLYDEKEAYDWFMDALLYILTACPWKDPNSSVYNDPKAIERMLNTCVNCSRANWFQASNRQKRKINHSTSSYEALKEEYNDAFVPESLTSNMEDTSYKDLVVEYYNKQQYLLALMIDVIVNDVKLEGKTTDKLLISSIKKSIKSLPKTYYQQFALNYQLDPEQVEKSFSYIYNMTDVKLKETIELYLYKLRAVLKKEF